MLLRPDCKLSIRGRQGEVGIHLCRVHPERPRRSSSCLAASVKLRPLVLAVNTPHGDEHGHLVAYNHWLTLDTLPHFK